MYVGPTRRIQEGFRRGATVGQRSQIQLSSRTRLFDELFINGSVGDDFVTCQLDLSG
jgi:hypothetical protein